MKFRKILKVFLMLISLPVMFIGSTLAARLPMEVKITRSALDCLKRHCHIDERNILTLKDDVISRLRGNRILQLNIDVELEPYPQSYSEYYDLLGVIGVSKSYTRSPIGVRAFSIFYEEESKRKCILASSEEVLQALELQIISSDQAPVARSNNLPCMNVSADTIDRMLNELRMELVSGDTARVELSN